ncbi:MAG: sulfotransferase [Planctomycetota bacterium]
MSDVTPIFLLSLPRCGSTLTQRIMASHLQIATTSEPWILLPQLYSLRAEGVYAEYWHRATVRGIEDFCEELPGKRADYLRVQRDAAQRLYTLARDRLAERDECAPDARYFLDKSIRYHFVVDELFELYPDAKFVFLWRNPLAQIASTLEAWSQGNWNLFLFRADLYEGLANLIDASTKFADRSITVRYEDLTGDPESTWPVVFEHLGLTWDSSQLENFARVDLRGRLGDSVGMRSYDKLERAPLDKWKATLANPLRKQWCRRYLRWIGRDRLATMGYDLDALQEELRSIRSGGRHLLGDAWRRPMSVPFVWLELETLKDKLRAARARRIVVPHR